MSTDTSRRDFFKVSAALTTAVSADRVLGANDRIRFGIIGSGGRGSYIMAEIKRNPDTEIVAVCDVYDVRRARGAKLADSEVKQYADHRQLLDHKDIDAVVVATPDHWHSAITVDACQAGKDVYCEKPMVHYPKDGQAIVKAMRQNKRIVAVGTHGRLIAHMVEAKEKFVDSGALGKIGFARTWYMSNSGYVQQAPPGFEKKPEGLDWDHWCGPALHVPWNPDIYFSPYKWQNYCGGMIMGIAIHVLDQAHHLLQLTKPKTAVAGGGIYFYNDGRDTPDVVTFTLDYPENVTLTYSGECLDCPGVRTSAGVELRGTGGKLTLERYFKEFGYEYAPNKKFSNTPPATAPGTPNSAEGNVKNWLECMRTRRKPVADAVDGYYSSIACFMANQAWRTKSRVVWDPQWNLPAA